LQIPIHFDEKIYNYQEFSLTDCFQSLIDLFHKRSRGSLVFFYSIGSLHGCLSVRHYFISSLSFDAGNKKNGASDKGILCQQFQLSDF